MGGGRRTGPLPLHPMGVGDILDGAFKLMKGNVATIVVIVAVFVVPVQFVAAYTQRNLFGGAGFLDMLSDPSLVDAAETSGQTGTDVALSAVALVAQLIVLPFMAGAISLVVASSYLGRDLGAGEALRRVARKAWALFASWVLVHLLQVAGFVVVVALVVGAAMSVRGVAVAFGVVAFVVGLASVVSFVAVVGLSVMVAPAVVVEDLGPVAGIRRSWGLTRGRFWPVLGIALLAGFLAQVLGSVLNFVPSVAGLLVGMEHGWAITALGGILASIITEPVVAIVATLLYFDARIRREGFDLQVIASELSPARAPYS